MKNTDEVAIFWDYENCPAPTNTSGYTIVNSIQSIAQIFGSVTSFKAYLEVTEQVPVSRALVLRSELQSSGVSLTDCPHNGRKDVADKIIIVDMLAYAIDNSAPSTIVLISGDRDFAYALAILKLRRYHIILITLSNAHPSLRAQASLCFDWISDVIEPVQVLSHQPSPRQEKECSPAHDKFYSDPKGHNLSRHPFQELYDVKSASNVELMNYFQDATRRKENSRIPLKHDARNGFLPPDQPTASSVASSARIRPETCARVIRSPVASSCSCPTYLDDNIETTLTMISRNSNPSQPTLTPNPSIGAPNSSIGNTTDLATYRSDIPSRFPRHSTTLQGSANLGQNDVARVPEPMSFESAAMPISPAEPDLRGSSGLAKRDTYNAKTHSLSSFDQMNDDGDLAQSDISPPPNITSPPSASVPFLSLNNVTTSPVARSSVEVANPKFQPISCPPVPDKFKILVQCLQTHRSQGRVRILRSQIALQIACNGKTYRQAGVLKFSQYIAMAAKAGIVELGGSELVAWIALRAPWHYAPLS